MYDLGYFVVILAVFIVSHVLVSQAILYPNAPLNLSLLKEIWRKPYWQMYGELFLEEIEGLWKWFLQNKVPIFGYSVLRHLTTVIRYTKQSFTVTMLNGRII